MTMTDGPTDPLLARIRRAFPRLQIRGLRILQDSPQGLRIGLDGHYVVRIPRGAQAAARLRRGCQLAPRLGPLLPLALPLPQLDDWQPPMTIEPRLPGLALTPARLAALLPAAQATLARDLAGLIAALHRIAPPQAEESLPILGDETGDETAGETAESAAAETARALRLLPASMRLRLGQHMAALRPGLGPAHAPDSASHALVIGHFAWAPDQLLIDAETGQLCGLTSLGALALGAPWQDFAALMRLDSRLGLQAAAHYARLQRLALPMARLRALDLAQGLQALGRAAPADQPGLIRALALRLAAPDGPTPDDPTPDDPTPDDPPKPRDTAPE